MTMEFQHWHFKVDDNNIVHLTIDRADSSANSLNRAVLTEFNDILDTLNQGDYQGVIIDSAKASGFILGADIEQFTELTDAESAFNLIRQGQQIFDKLAALKIPSVAVIDGFCLGGGFEFALACRYRIASNDGKTKIGLPEVLLGLHPGWGGTVRLPRLIGAGNALAAILSGKFYDARKAAKLGMIDAAVPKRHLQGAALHYVMKKPKPHRATRKQRLSNTYVCRWLIYQLQTNRGFNRVLAKLPGVGKAMRGNLINMITPEQYPAPFAVMKNWLKQGVGRHAIEAEARSFSEIVFTEASKNLVRLFFLTERLKGLGKKVKFKPKRIHIIGAGTMGGDIAAWCALRGMQVTLQDRTPEQIGPAIKRAHQLFKRRLKKPRLITQAMDRLLPDPQGLCVKQADVIIEAIFENLQAKQELFKFLEENAKADAILATNTSSIALDDINQVMKNPERLVGIHFFNPVAKLKLVEVISGEKTSQEVIDKASGFVTKIDHYPVPVKSSPGFLVNRILMPYLMEAVTLHEEGVPLAVIDKAAKKFGMPMGPVELIDNVGLDIGLAVAEYLTKAFGGSIPEILSKKVKAGDLGKKSGKGFYEYKKGRTIKPDVASDYRAPEDLTDRLMVRMVNEACACLREGVVADGDLLDAAMIYGTGFAPFRGGPMQYSKTVGIENFREKLQQLEHNYGERFKEDKAWSKEVVE